MVAFSYTAIVLGSSETVSMVVRAQQSDEQWLNKPWEQKRP